MSMGWPPLGISIHAPREGSDQGALFAACQAVISIYAPREGSDLLGYSDERDHTISIHAPREGSDGGSHPPCGK